MEPINFKECNVKYVDITAQVNLDARSCTCGQFDLDHIPCAHAIAAYRHYNIECYTLCSQYFTTKALLSSYSESIYPSRSEIDWIIPDYIQNKVVLPPKTKRPARRLRKVRILFGGEGKHTSHYSRCGQYGHMIIDLRDLFYTLNFCHCCLKLFNSLQWCQELDID